jgi:hypothetical protein
MGAPMRRDYILDPKPAGIASHARAMTVTFYPKGKTTCVACRKAETIERGGKWMLACSLGRSCDTTCEDFHDARKPSFVMVQQ